MILAALLIACAALAFSVGSAAYWRWILPRQYARIEQKIVNGESLSGREQRRLHR